MAAGLHVVKLLSPFTGMESEIRSVDVVVAGGVKRALGPLCGGGG